MGCAVNAFAQGKQPNSKEVTTVKTTVTTVASDVNLLGAESLTLNFVDAVPLKTNTVDLRLTGKWITANAPANRGHSHDDWVVAPTIVWGAYDNLELSATVPTWVNDNDIPGQQDGNYDAYFGALWRFRDQEDYWPAMALGTTIRTPTGDHSNGLDAELRLSMTNEYDNGLRSHMNFFLSSVNTDNNENARHFQYGAVVGLDGPLCADGAVRWVLDYMWRISDSYGGGHMNMVEGNRHNMWRTNDSYGGGPMNIVEGGWQWQIADAHKLGMSIQAGLDHAENSTPNMGAALTYAYTIAN